MESASHFDVMRVDELIDAELYARGVELLDRIADAKSKDLLIRDDDVQVLHGFETAEQVHAYLKSVLFTADVGEALKPLLDAPPEVRIYQQA